MTEVAAASGAVAAVRDLACLPRPDQGRTRPAHAAAARAQTHASRVASWPRGVVPSPVVDGDGRALCMPASCCVTRWALVPTAGNRSAPQLDPADRTEARIAMARQVLPPVVADRPRCRARRACWPDTAPTPPTIPDHSASKWRRSCARPPAAIVKRAAWPGWLNESTRVRAGGCEAVRGDPRHTVVCRRDAPTPPPMRCHRVYDRDLSRSGRHLRAGPRRASTGWACRRLPAERAPRAARAARGGDIARAGTGRLGRVAAGSEMGPGRGAALHSPPRRPPSRFGRG